MRHLHVVASRRSLAISMKKVGAHCVSLQHSPRQLLGLRREGSIHARVLGRIRSDVREDDDVRRALQPHTPNAGACL